MKTSLRIHWLVLGLAAVGACADTGAGDTSGDFDFGIFEAQTNNVTTPENTAVDAVIFSRSDYHFDSFDAGPHQATASGGTLHIVPMPDFTGTFSVSYVVSNGTDTASNSLYVYVSLADDHYAPKADDLDLTLHGVVDFDLSAHDAEGDDASFFVYTIATQPAHGTLRGTGRNQTYTPSPGYVGDDSFTFNASYIGEASSRLGTVHLHVIAGSAPSAGNVAVSTLEDMQVGIPLSLYTFDPDGDVLSYSIRTPPAHGTVNIGPAASYQPTADYHGPDSFEYTVSDGVHSASGTVTITVASVNDAPTVFDQTVEATEDLPASIALTGLDADGDPVTFQINSQPSHGTVTGSGAALTYTPVANFNGTDSFTFTAHDPLFATSRVATVTIHVASVGDRPVAPSIAVNVNEDAPTSIALPGNDPDGTPVTVTIVSAPSHGTATVAGVGVVYTSNLDYNGPDALTYTVSSGGETSDPGTVTLTVVPVNDAPQAQPATLTTGEDTSLSIVLTATDVDNTAAQLTYSIAQNPQHGTLSGTPPNVVYTPTHNFAGDDAFFFTVSDGHLGTSARVNVGVLPANDPPTPVDDYAATDPGQPLTFDVLGNDTDPDGDTVMLDSAAAPAHGTIEIDGSKLSYTPDDGFTGLDTFTYTVVDPSGEVGSATVHMGVGTFPTGAPIERLPLADAATSVAVTPTLSGDGRFVVFSTAGALVADDTNLVTDVYLYDRGRRELKRISVASDGSQANAISFHASLSANGRYVVYESDASNLVAGDTNAERDVFRYDRITGTTIRVSVSTAGGQGSGPSLISRISDDGDTVAFLSDSFELVANDTNGARDAFVHTVSTGVTERVSVSNSGGEADLNTLSLALSGDGHVVAFESSATNLVAGDTNARNDVFVRDRVHGTTTRVSVSSTGGEANSASSLPSLSSDGRFVAFVSTATNLVTAVTGQTLYVRDTMGSITTHPVAGAASWGWLSADGRYLTASASSGPQIVDRFAARSQSITGGSFPVISASGRYAVTSVSGSTSGELIIVPNPL